MNNKHFRVSFWLMLISALSLGPLFIVTKNRADAYSTLAFDPIFLLVPLCVILFVVSSLIILATRRKTLQSSQIAHQFCFWFIPISTIVNSLIWLYVWSEVGIFFSIWATFMTLAWLIIWSIVAIGMHFSDKNSK